MVFPSVYGDHRYAMTLVGSNSRGGVALDLQGLGYLTWHRDLALISVEIQLDPLSLATGSIRGALALVHDLGTGLHIPTTCFHWLTPLLPSLINDRK